MLLDIKDIYPDIILEFKYGNNVLIVDRIIIPKEKRNKGIGTEIMTMVTKEADRGNFILMLSPSDSLGATSVNRLKRFYKRFGFIDNKGKKKRFELPLYSMYRIPQ